MPALQWIEVTRTTPSGTAYATNDEIRKAFDDMGLWPAGVGLGDDDRSLRRFRELARPIFDAMPSGTLDERSSRERARKNIVLASVVPRAGGVFVITRETSGGIVMLLHNSTVDGLQDGCHQMAKRLQASDALRFKLGPIRIIRAGDTEPIMDGRVVGSGLKARARFLYRQARARVMTATALSALLLLSVLAQLTGLPHGKEWQDALANLTIGLIPAAVVAILSILPERPVRSGIQWTSHYSVPKGARID